ncbi:MAG TPA: hypothetical protein VIV60_07130 [Polyangiaceae bacterium]
MRSDSRIIAFALRTNDFATIENPASVVSHLLESLKGQPVVEPRGFIVIGDRPISKPDYFVEHRLGRLVVTRLCSMHDVQAVAYVQRTMANTLMQIHASVVLCADWEHIGVLSPQVAEAVISMLAVTNSKIACSGILLSPQAATFNLQAERVIRDADNPARKAFRDRRKLLEWFGGFLQPDEMQAATEFLREVTRTTHR